MRHRSFGAGPRNNDCPPPSQGRLCVRAHNAQRDKNKEGKHQSMSPRAEDTQKRKTQSGSSFYFLREGFLTHCPLVGRRSARVRTQQGEKSHGALCPCVHNEKGNGRTFSASADMTGSRAQPVMLGSAHIRRKVQPVLCRCARDPKGKRAVSRPMLHALANIRHAFSVLQTLLLAVTSGAIKSSDAKKTEGRDRALPL
jgi:hypothetical protein